MLILVTNDDGVRSPGLKSLALAMGALGDVFIVAPDRNRSAVGHALTLDQPLRAEEIKPQTYAVDGTPTDCVTLGIHGLLPGRPDLVVSGINRGSNLGDDVTYSGTVSAALEASLMGFPAFSVSLDLDSFNPEDLEIAAGASVAIAEKIISEGLDPGVFLNVNVPTGGVRGMKITRLGRRRYGDMVVTKRDPRGRPYYWLGGTALGFENVPESDGLAIDEKLISVTPLHADMTHLESLNRLKCWTTSEGG
jgi:5'-nucleotidase